MANESPSPFEVRLGTVEDSVRSTDARHKSLDERIAALEKTWFRVVAGGSAIGMALLIVFGIGAVTIPSAALDAGKKAGSEAGKVAAEDAAKKEVETAIGPKVQKELRDHRERAKDAAEKSEENLAQIITTRDRLEHLKDFPPGTILSLYLEGDDEAVYRALPRIWVLCDGKVLNAQHPRNFNENEVDPTLWNRRSPNLEG